MAQSVEQLICNLQVMGSSPFTSSRKKQKALTEISVRAFLFGVPRGLCAWFAAGPGNKFAALLAAICARIGSKKAKRISLRRYWQQFARVLAVKKQKARREKSRLFLLVRLSFGVWKYRHAQALDPIRFQEADIAELSQLVQLCPV